MKELHGKVAVITGAASGFGREFAIRCADEGMKTVLTNIDTGGLGTTVALLKPGTEFLVIGSDVSSADSIEHLARSTYDRFGACHLLFNNAGVGTTGPIWTATLDDWKWTLGINLMGVVHGLRSFVPRMLAQIRFRLIASVDHHRLNVSTAMPPVGFSPHRLQRSHE
jgi:NAD(P)-dependent dehydrogenase (short-subunit alcohol dehydrogenase family)